MEVDIYPPYYTTSRLKFPESETGTTASYNPICLAETTGIEHDDMQRMT
jgi:hypothetical protein